MAFDEALAERLRVVFADVPGVREQKMFGGIAFMANGNLAVGASSAGGLIVRADPETCDEFLEPGVELMEMRGRPMRGWLHVDATRVESDTDLATWVERGLGYAQSLPPK